MNMNGIFVADLKIVALLTRKFSPCSPETATRFSGKKSKCESRKWTLRDMLLHSNKCYGRKIQFLERFNCKDLRFTKKLRHTFKKAPHALFSVDFIFAEKLRSSKSFFICGPTKMPSLILALVTRGNFSFKYAKIGPFLSTNTFMKPSFM